VAVEGGDGEGEKEVSVVRTGKWVECCGVGVVVGYLVLLPLVGILEDFRMGF